MIQYDDTIYENSIRTSKDSVYVIDIGMSMREKGERMHPCMHIPYLLVSFVAYKPSTACSRQSSRDRGSAETSYCKHRKCWTVASLFSHMLDMKDMVTSS
jgi:hypothetical protein